MKPAEEEIVTKLLTLIKESSQPELQLNINNYSEFIRAVATRRNMDPLSNS
jgi:hypothetical protein